MDGDQAWYSAMMDNLELSMADVPIGGDDIDVTAVEVPSLESDLVSS